jgi:hypothetical protein
MCLASQKVDVWRRVSTHPLVAAMDAHLACLGAIIGGPNPVNTTIRWGRHVRVQFTIDSREST